MARSFLRQIAQYYLNQIDPRHLKDITFVFPNRRSGQFFERELHEHAKGPLVLPRVTTFIEWMGDITQVVPVTSIESVFLLYRAYKQEMGDNADDMEHFVHWASIIVNDFNDVDRSLVDARDLYTNIGNWRDLRTDYLEDDLKELARSLKQKCGVGGSVKDFNIEIQGDKRNVLKAELEKKGYTVKLAGG